MLYHFLVSMTDYVSAFNVFKYITFRTFVASLTSLLICFLVGPYFITFMKKKKIEQVIREDGPKSHLGKKGTPSMGGLLILFSILVSSILWVNLSNPYLWSVIFILVSFGLVGFVDDFLKIYVQSSQGLRGYIRLILEFLAAFIVALYFFLVLEVDTTLYFPFLKNLTLELGWFYIPFTMVVIVGCANGVNLTDGLDGLAIGPIIISTTTLVLLTYIAGNTVIARYLNIPYVENSGELAIFCGITAAACLGFLWYNTFPATVFMGDVGSISIGGIIGLMAVITKNELLLVILGGIFVVEVLSVIIQVFWFKLTGRRVFRMAPIHHHFELKGWAEPKVIVRFWIISIILSIMALGTLKLR